MGVFRAFFGRRGVVGFNGCCSWASNGDGGFTLACSSGRRGGGGCTVATSLHPVRERVRPANEKWTEIGVLWRGGRVFSRVRLEMEYGGYNLVRNNQADAC